MPEKRNLNQNDWDYIIKPKRGWFEVNLREIWEYRDLLTMYVKRNLLTLYKHTVLGPFWLILQSLITIVIYMFIFGGLAGISTEGIPQPLFYMAGILLWNYFNDCFQASNNVLVSNADIFGKVYFPRLIVPLASIVSSLGKLGIQFILFLVIYFFCLFFQNNLSLNWTIIFTPFYILIIAFFGMSLGLLVTSLTYKYRDLQLLITYFLQLLMYATPVVYPLETIPEKYKVIVELNPLTSIFETFKYGWFNTGFYDWQGMIYSCVFLILLVSFSILFFNRMEQNFIDTV